MELDLSGKIVLITSENPSDLGSCVSLFLQQGALVACLTSNVPTKEVLDSGLNEYQSKKVLFIQTSFRDQESICRAITQILQEFGRIDILVNFSPTTIHKFRTNPWELEAFDLLYRIGLRQTMMVIHEVWRLCPQSRQGCVVTVCREEIELQFWSSRVHAQLEAILKGFTLSCAAELSSSGGWAVTISSDMMWTGLQAPGQDKSESPLIVRRTIDYSEVSSWVLLASSSTGRRLAQKEHEARSAA